MSSRKGLTKRALRRMLREATEILQDVAWPTHVALMRLQDALEGRADKQAVKQAAGRLVSVDSKLMLTATSLEQLLRGILPEARSARNAGQLTLAW